MTLQVKRSDPLKNIDNLYQVVMHHPKMTTEAALVLVGYHYHEAYAPLENYTIDQWVDMFAKGGATTDKPDPLKLTTVYRGCFPEHREGMSWTQDIRAAACFAQQRGAPHIYTMEITGPEAIFHYPPRETPHAFSIDQVVIDARGRDMELLHPSKHTVCIDPFTKALHHRKKRPGDKPWRYLPAGSKAFMEVAHIERKREDDQPQPIPTADR